jgi:hypothetical protein
MNALTLNAVAEMAHVLSCAWTRSKRAGSASRQAGNGLAPFPRTIQGDLCRLRRPGHGRARAPFQTDDARDFECREIGRGYSHLGGRLVFIFSNGEFYTGRDHITVTTHPSESQPISLSLHFALSFMFLSYNCAKCFAQRCPKVKSPIFPAFGVCDSIVCGCALVI